MITQRFLGSRSGISWSWSSSWNSKSKNGILMRETSCAEAAVAMREDGG